MQQRRIKEDKSKSIMHAYSKKVWKMVLDDIYQVCTYNFINLWYQASMQAGILVKMIIMATYIHTNSQADSI